MVSSTYILVLHVSDLVESLLTELLQLFTRSMDELKIEHDSLLQKIHQFLLHMIPAQPSATFTPIQSLSVSCLAALTVSTGTVNEVLALTGSLLDMSLHHFDSGTYNVGFPVVRALKNWEEKVLIYDY